MAGGKKGGKHGGPKGKESWATGKYSQDVVNIILRRYLAEELLNALIIALGPVSYDKKKKKNSS